MSDVFRRRVAWTKATRVHIPMAGHARLCLALAAALCALATGGCAPRAIANSTAGSIPIHKATHLARVSKPQLPLADRSLLERQPEPDCAFRDTLSNPATSEEMRMKLDYEQQCYRQSEAIARARLEQLQNAIEHSKSMGQK
jgi:hypothetical protein